MLFNTDDTLTHTLFALRWKSGPLVLYLSLYFNAVALWFVGKLLRNYMDLVLNRRENEWKRMVLRNCRVDREIRRFLLVIYVPYETCRVIQEFRRVLCCKLQECLLIYNITEGPGPTRQEWRRRAWVPRRVQCLPLPITIPLSWRIPTSGGLHKSSNTHCTTSLTRQ